MGRAEPRKQPRQARAQATVDAIVQAATHLLVSDGFHNLSTNRIAAHAGVSIGSLYQYFPNKEAVVALVVERFAERQFEIFAQGLAAVVDAPLEQGVRRLIGTLMEAKCLEPELSRVLFEELPDVGQMDVLRAWTQRACEVVSAALQANEEEVRPLDTELAAFVLVTACNGIVHAAVVDRPDLLSDPALADNTADLVLRYLRRE